MAIVDGRIRCPRCGETKPIADFRPAFVARGHGQCRACQRGKKLAYYGRHKGAFRARKLLAKYGLSPAAYDAMAAQQEGRCASCGVSGRRLLVDHDHVTGAIRGLLCHRCNVGIGQLGDTIVGVRRALSYLERAGTGRPA